ncbi:MAG: sigma-70 family RNA polymerase sigma factor [Lachnospiraceae bacterium]|nr:sigma-70 family RNA polymerase sigma factor [Lachnospiraceae bacterium]
MFIFLALLDSPGEQEKFAEIYNQYRHFMWYVANQRLKDEHLAEDAVQEAFLALTRHLDKVEDVHSARTRNFLATIVRSKAADILRKSRPEEELTEKVERGGWEGDALEQYLKKEQYNALVACVLELDEGYRVVFEYKYIYRMTDKEIGDILGISAKNVNVRCFRARKQLQEMLRKEAERYEKA